MVEEELRTAVGCGGSNVEFSVYRSLPDISSAPRPVPHSFVAPLMHSLVSQGFRMGTSLSDMNSTPEKRPGKRVAVWVKYLHTYI